MATSVINGNKGRNLTEITLAPITPLPPLRMAQPEHPTAIQLTQTLEPPLANYIMMGRPLFNQERKSQEFAGSGVSLVIALPLLLKM